MRLRKSWILPLIALLALTLQGPAHAARDIYPAPEQAKTDLASALERVAGTHRRVLVDFGGNWCTDCHVLDLYLHDAQNLPILDGHFVLVHVNIGRIRIDQNLDLAARYNIPLNKGVPALAVLESDGTLLYSQTSGEFEAMRGMRSASVTEFLNRWKSAAPD